MICAAMDFYVFLLYFYVFQCSCTVFEIWYIFEYLTLYYSCSGESLDITWLKCRFVLFIMTVNKLINLIWHVGVVELI